MPDFMGKCCYCIVDITGISQKMCKGDILYLFVRWVKSLAIFKKYIYFYFKKDHFMLEKR